MTWLKKLLVLLLFSVLTAQFSVSNAMAADFARCGINIDPMNPMAKPDPAALEGVGWARFVFKVNQGAGESTESQFAQYDEYINQLASNNVGIILILNQETYWGNGAFAGSGGDFNGYAAGFAEQARKIAVHYGSSVQAFEIWNEPDAPAGAAGAAHLSPQQLNILVTMASQQIDAGLAESGLSWQPQILAGGFLGGEGQIQEYLNNMSQALSVNGGVVSGHPYTKGPNEISAYVNSLLGTASSVWLTEISSVNTTGAGYTTGTDDPEGSAKYIRDVFESLNSFGARVPAAVWFAWSDTQQDAGIGIFGLNDTSGNPKQPLYDAFYEDACNTTVKLDSAKRKKRPLFIIPGSSSGSQTVPGGSSPDSGSVPSSGYFEGWDVDMTEWNKYLANSQVYCAPAQVNWPSTEGTAPPLPNCAPADSNIIDPLNQGAVNIDGSACEPQEYPVVNFVENYNLSSLSLPLFRNQSGGISIEYDLSRVNPDDTLAVAAKRNARSDYAPQFYLSSPQMQCLNAWRYIQYVNGLCANYEKAGEECPSKHPIDFPGGGFQSWDSASRMLSEEMCLNFSVEINQDSDAAKLVRSLQTYTPKAYKMGFLVQHNYLFDSGVNSLLGRGQYLVKSIAAWLKGDTEPDPRIKEYLVVVPIWYQSGITTNEYNRDQLAAYPIDPETIEPEHVEISENNFKGPWWQTYAPVLTLEIQERIFSDKAKVVKENYQYLLEMIKRTNTDDVLPCEDEDCVRHEIGYLEELRESFPLGFFEGQSSGQVYSFLIGLQRSIVARVNSGVQATQPYIPLDKRPEDYTDPSGPLSVRSFNRCEVDPKNILLGESETSLDINYQALQMLVDEGDDGSGISQAIDSIRNEFRAKILWQDPDLANQFPKSYSYIILPDESIDIDIAQAYVTPMFLSPQMYDSIMSGENPVYPWKTDGGVDGGESAEYLSAFLRTSGYDRQYNSEERGYVKMERIISQYGTDCTIPPGGGDSVDPTMPLCTCTMERVGEPIVEEFGWQEYPSSHINEEPTIANGCRKVEYIQKEKSTVKAIDSLPEDDPDSNLQVPGKTIALHEYLRRMAFTPHYLIQKYEGLEQFYQNGVPIPEFLKKSLDKLSGYFAQLLNISSTFGEANSAGTCGTVYVTRDKAQQYANEIRQLMSPAMKADMLAQYPRAQLYGECGGQDCVEFILSTVLEYPICNGDRYVNPYMAIAIGMHETGGLSGIGDNNTGFHFGCSPIAFSAYKPGATHNGMQCVVENATPNQVINPLLVWNDDVLNSCVDVSGGAVPTYGTVRREQTAEDGLACMVATFHRYCQSIEGDNIDIYAIQGDPNVAEDMYGYASFPGPLVGRFNDLITLAGRAGTLTPDIENRVRSSITEMTSGCVN